MNLGRNDHVYVERLSGLHWRAEDINRASRLQKRRLTEMLFARSTQLSGTEPGRGFRVRRHADIGQARFEDFQRGLQMRCFLHRLCDLRGETPPLMAMLCASRKCLLV